MTTYPERQQYVEWINEAVNNGARKTKACKLIGLSVRTLQRWTKTGAVSEDRRPLVLRQPPSNALSQDERLRILDVCRSPEFASLPPSQIVPILADRGEYIGSESSFYRILKAENQQHHRGRAKAKGTSKRPTSYTAHKANEVWTWDISYLVSTVIGRHYYLYMIEDIYSRKVVGWEVHHSENGEDAAVLLQRSIWSEKCSLNDLVLHSDNGAPMKSFTMQAKMLEMGITSSHSRPRVSNDNPFSESLFRTLKYCPSWPSKGFATIDDARIWVKEFVQWYNNEHRHSRINFVTPNQRHNGDDVAILKQRHELYTKVKNENPKRWSGNSRNWQPEGAVELNPEQNKLAA